MKPQSSDSQSRSTIDVLDRFIAIAVALALTVTPFVVAALLLAFVAAPIFESFTGGVLSDASRPVAIVVNWFALHVAGFGATAAVFVQSTGRGSDYVPIEWSLTVGDLRAIVAVGGVGVAFDQIVERIAAALGVPVATHSTTSSAAGEPAFAALFIVGTLLIVAPAEELFFRGVIQSYLAERFDLTVAIVATSVFFTLPHVAAYGGASPVGLAVPIGMTFAVSCVLGWLYGRTENLLAPIIAHGLFNTLSLLVAVA